MRDDLRQRIDEDADTRVDLSPLIDVVFILLIFFIVTTVFVRETGVDVDKPQAVTSETLDRNAILIAIGRNGNVVHDGNSIGAHGVRPLVSQLIRSRQRPVVVQADRMVTAELLIQVIDEAKLAGAESVSVATEKR